MVVRETAFVLQLFRQYWVDKMEPQWSRENIEDHQWKSLIRCPLGINSVKSLHNDELDHSVPYFARHLPFPWVDDLSLGEVVGEL